jgi:DNA polymerase-3 subunit gamma/tau
MLGLGDRLRVLDLFDAVMRGAAPEVLDRFGELYGLGVDPAALVQDLLDVCHSLSRLKVRPEAGGALGLGGELLKRARAMAEDLSLPVLARAWQMLLRGTEEVRAAPDGAAAAEMLLLRLACVAELPPPAELARLLRGGDPPPPSAGMRAAPAPTSPPARERAVVAVAVPSAAAAVPAAGPPVPAAAPPSSPRRGGAAGPAAHLRGARGGYRAGRRAAAGGDALREHGADPLRARPDRAAPRRSGAPGPAEPVGRDSGPPHRPALDRGGGRRRRRGRADARGPGVDRRRRRIAELADDPSFKALLETFPGAEIVDVREPAPVPVEAAAATAAAAPNAHRGAREA